MRRLRIHRTTWPRPALVLTDTPRPNCWACNGDGGHQRDYGDPETGEYAGTDWELCPCWDGEDPQTLLPLPRITLHRHRARSRDPWAQGGHSNEPPF